MGIPKQTERIKIMCMGLTCMESFDKEEVAEAVVTSIGKKGLDVSEMTGVDFAEYKENSMTCLRMV